MTSGCGEQGPNLFILGCSVRGANLIAVFDSSAERYACAGLGGLQYEELVDVTVMEQDRYCIS